MFCAKKGFLDMEKILPANKLDTYKINISGNTSFILPVKEPGAADMASFIVSNSNANLEKAVDSGDLNTIYISLLNGADLNDLINSQTIQKLLAKKGILHYKKVVFDCNIFIEQSFIEELKYRDPTLLETIVTRESNSINQITMEGSRVMEETTCYTSVDKSIVQLLFAKCDSLKTNGSNIRRRYNKNFSILVRAVSIVDIDLVRAEPIVDLDLVRWLCIKRSNLNKTVHYNPFTPLIASKGGSTEITQCLMPKGSDIGVQVDEGTALDIAVKYGQFDCAEILPEQKAKKGLVEACNIATNNKQLCLLEHLDDKFVLDTKETNFLQWAIQSGNKEIFQYLIEQVMYINKSITGRHYSTSKYAQFLSPLHLAVIKERPDLIKVLLQSKADINIKDLNGNTALFYACAKKSHEMLNLLLKAGSEVNVVNVLGKTPLSVAIENTDEMNTTLLLNSSASVNACDNSGETLLLKAIQRQSLKIVSLLIEMKADTSTITKNGGTYITELLRSFEYYFDFQRMLEILKLLLKESIDINKQDECGDSALSIGCKSRHSMTESVKILLEHGANVNSVNSKNESPLSLSLVNHKFDIAKMLLKKQAIFYPISICQLGVHLFVSKNQAELIPLALGNGVFPFVVKAGYSGEQMFYSSYRNKTDLSPLSLALYETRLDIAKYLIQERFLTKYDVSDLLKTGIFQITIQSAEKGTIFKNLLSLYTLSFVQISEVLGACLDRETKVNQLPLPTKMKHQLLFRSVNV